MKVIELVAKLLQMPQDAEVCIVDADEHCLLHLEEGDVSFSPADTRPSYWEDERWGKWQGYRFPRVEIGGDYFLASGDDRRVERKPE